jgi:cytosine/adenosine deaminase-related metal-dependent hydrolase
MMAECCCTVYLGTDNVMFVPPDLFGEMAFVSTVYKSDSASILRSAIGGSALLGTPYYIQTGARANLLVIDPEKNSLNFSRDPVTSIIKRVSSHMIANNVFNSELQ